MNALSGTTDTLVELWQSNLPFRVVAVSIMASRSRLSWKRDQLKRDLRDGGISVAFKMADLRALQYYLHPADAKRGDSPKTWA